jgi:pyruvate formate lyase activating enzyme
LLFTTLESMTQGYLFDIKRYAIHDGPGIRVALFLQGCPLRCWWCHNPEGMRTAPSESLGDRQNSKVRLMTTADAIREIEKEILFFDESGGGVTFSGGEPFIQRRFLSGMLDECRKREIHTAVDTSGYAPREIVQSMMDRVDLFLYDLKLMDEREHERYTGVSNRLILDNLQMLAESGKRIAIRFPLIPAITDTEENLSRMLDFLVSLQKIDIVSILPFHKTARAKYRRLEMEDRTGEIEPPTPEWTAAVKDRFERAGFRAQIGG